MAIRTIICIDEEKCTGCGLCVTACHEGALGLVDGKAKLLRENYCDGMGDCLPQCPVDAISFVEREAPAYDEVAVQMTKGAAAAAAGSAQPQVAQSAALRAAAPGTGFQLGSLAAGAASDPAVSAGAGAAAPRVAQSAAGGVVAPLGGAQVVAAPAGSPAVVAPLGGAATLTGASQISNWPVQLKLAPVSAPAFAGADLLVAADCTAFSYGAFHRDFMAGRTTLIGCPKLDAVDYAEKLGAIIAANSICSITMVRMSVPCCGGLESATRRALAASGKDLPLQVVTISTDGRLLG